jgi:hypothetical protein
MRPTLSDHLAEVFLGHAKLENMRVFPDDFLDLNIIRTIH